MKIVTKKIAIIISFMLIAISGSGQVSNNNETDLFYKKIAYDVQHHSYYIPIFTADSIRCVIENSSLFWILGEKYSTSEEYSYDIYRSLCKNGIINVPFCYAGHEDELMLVSDDVTIPGVDMADKSAIIKGCFTPRGCLKKQYLSSKYEGVIIENLFLHRVAVTTDCETGTVMIEKEHKR